MVEIKQQIRLFENYREITRINKSVIGKQIFDLTSHVKKLHEFNEILIWNFNKAKNKSYLKSNSFFVNSNPTSNDKRLIFILLESSGTNSQVVQKLYEIKDYEHDKIILISNNKSQLDNVNLGNNNFKFVKKYLIRNLKFSNSQLFATTLWDICKYQMFIDPDVKSIILLSSPGNKGTKIVKLLPIFEEISDLKMLLKVDSKKSSIRTYVPTKKLWINNAIENIIKIKISCEIIYQDIFNKTLEIINLDNRINALDDKIEDMITMNRREKNKLMTEELSIFE